MKAIEFIERLALSLFVLGLVVYVLIKAKLWAADYSLWFFRTGDLQAFLVLSVALYLFGKLLEKFLRWEVNFFLPHRRRHK